MPKASVMARQYFPDLLPIPYQNRPRIASLYSYIPAVVGQRIHMGDMATLLGAMTEAPVSHFSGETYSAVCGRD